MRASLMFQQSNEAVGFHFPVVYMDKMSVCIHADLGDIGTIIPGLAHSTFNKSKRNLHWSHGSPNNNYLQWDQVHGVLGG
jgi:hypothetical protein